MQITQKSMENNREKTDLEHEERGRGFRKHQALTSLQITKNLRKVTGKKSDCEREDRESTGIRDEPEIEEDGVEAAIAELRGDAIREEEELSD